MRSLPAEHRIWFHAASLGEYAIARPLIKQLKATHPQAVVVVTFFSSTGYEALKHHHPDVDALFYLPLDAPKQVRRFLDAVQPEKAVFIVSEFWLNYLTELKQRSIPTFLLSAIIRPNAIFFRWYGSAFRRALSVFTHITVLNAASAHCLDHLGYTRYSLVGDPLFDNAIAVAQTPYQNPLVERFAAGRSLFIVGSLHDRTDLELVASLANRHPEVPFLIVPHEVTARSVNEIKSQLQGTAICYTACTETTSFDGVQTLIVDTLGALSYLYRYGSWAYVGGGFTPYLHSIIEATVYGLPVAFGPRIERKVTPQELADRGIGTVVHSADELAQWFASLQSQPERLASIRQTAQAYTQENQGATQEILHLIAHA